MPNPAKPDFPLDEKWLMRAVGWQAMKAGRQLLSAGAVTAAARDGAVVKGAVQQGRRQLAAGIVIRSKTDVDNICSCPAARQTGALCEHSVAVVLAAIAGPKMEVARTPETSAERPDKRPAPAASPSAALSAVPLRVEISPELAEGWRRGRFSVKLAPLAEAEGAGAATAAAHARLAVWLAHEAGLAADRPPPFLGLNREQMASLLTALTGHPGVTVRPQRGALRELRISDVPVRPRLNVRIEDDSTAVLSRMSAPATDVLPGWIITRGAGDIIAPVAMGAAVESVPSSLRVLADDPSSEEVRLPMREFAGRLDAIQDAFELADAHGILRRLSIERIPPRPRLWIEGSLQNLSARLTFLYPGDPPLETGAEIRAEDDRFPIRLPGSEPRFGMRSLDLEEQAEQRLAGFSAPAKDGIRHLSGERQVMRFLASALPDLQRSWDVEIGERFRRVTANVERIAPKVSLAVAGDWLEVNMNFETPSGVRIPRDEIQRLFRTKEPRVRLPNGRLGIIDLDAVADLDASIAESDPKQTSANTFSVSRSEGEFLAATATAHGGAVAGDLGAPPSAPAVRASLWNALRPYQREGVNRMLENGVRGRGTLLADEMGLGKTIQILAFIETWLAASDRSAALVVCPTSLLANWASEAETFTPSLPVAIYHGADREIGDPRGLVITSYGILARDLAPLRKIPWAAVALDEASAIRNPATDAAKAARKLEADVRIALTGTPIENSPQDLWSIFQFVGPRLLGSREEFRDRYEAPLAAGAQTADDSARHAGARLRRRIAPYLIRRLKSSVAAELPERIEQTIFCDLSDSQREAYRRVLEETRRRVSEAAARHESDAAVRFTMLTSLLRLRQICCDARLAGLKGAGPSSGKRDSLRELLAEAMEGGHRTLVFSQFVSMLDIIGGDLERDGIAFCRLDGSTSPDARAEQVRVFQSGGPPVFLISLKAGGYGLNLTAADTVVHFDPWWNPAVEAQATDRAHRIGQRKTVTSYKLIARGTVEERILRLQSAKRSVVDAALDDETPLMRGLETRDLENLLDIA